MLLGATIMRLLRSVDGMVPPQSAVFPFIGHSTPRMQYTSAGVCQRPHTLYEEVANVLQNAVIVVSGLLDWLSSEISFPAVEAAEGPLGKTPSF